MEFGEARLQMHALLFDLDGTLADSNYKHMMAWREALRAEGILSSSVAFIFPFGAKKIRPSVTWAVLRNLPLRRFLLKYFNPARRYDAMRSHIYRAIQELKEWIPRFLSWPLPFDDLL